MDESINVVFGDCISDPFRSVNVDVCVGEVPALLAIIYNLPCYSLCRILATDKVVHHVRVTDTLLDRLGVAEIVFLVQLASPRNRRVTYNKYDSAEITGRLQMPLRHLLPVRHNDRASLGCLTVSV